jgi:hypothetical protein
MAKRYEAGDHRYEVVAGWPSASIKGIVSDVACDSAGRVYAAVRYTPDGKPLGVGPGMEKIKSSMLVFSRDGKLLNTWENAFACSHGLWIDRDDLVFHADVGTHTIGIYTTAGKLVRELGTRGRPGTPGAPFNMPTRAKRGPNGDIFVSDGYGQNRVHRFSADGRHILSWGKGDPVFRQERFDGKVTGKPGTGPGKFNIPHDVIVDPQSRVYVMDRTNHRCQVFSVDGKYQSEWTDVRNPNDSFIDSQGVMHITNGQAPRVELRRLDGTLIGRWGEAGVEPGQFANSPHGMWIDDLGDVYIAEVGGIGRLQKFARV